MTEAAKTSNQTFLGLEVDTSIIEVEIERYDNEVQNFSLDLIEYWVIQATAFLQDYPGALAHLPETKEKFLNFRQAIDDELDTEVDNNQ